MQDLPPSTPDGALRRRRWGAALTLLISLVVSVLASWRMQLAVRAEAKARFVGESDRLVAELARRITQSGYALHGLRASIAAGARLDRLQFRRWVAHRDLPVEFPGIRGLGFIERVPRADLAAFVARERADHAPDFSVQSTGDASDLLVITHIEPIARNLPALGLDIGAEAIRREAAQRAIDTGQLSLSGPIVLVQDERRGPGFLLFLPAYRPDVPLATASDRRAALIGLLYSPIAAAEVLSPLRSFVEGRLRFRLHDVEAAGPALYDSAAEDSLVARGQALLGQQVPLAIAGRMLIVHIESTRAFEAGLARFSPYVVLIAGVALSLLLASVFSRLLASRDAAEARSQQASLALAENEYLIRQMIDSVPARLSLWSPQLCCRLANQALCTALGRSREELVGMPLTAAAIGISDLSEVQPAIDAALRGEAQQREWSQRQPDGRVMSTLAHFLPRWREDEIRGLCILTLDISELKDAQRAAQQASEAKSRFLSRMSHEIRTPMNAVLGMLELLRATPLNAQQADYAGKAERAARSLLALINDVLDLSKIEAGRMTLDVRPFSPRAVLDEVAIVLSAALGDKPVALRCHCDAAVPAQLIGDELRIRQVLTNLGSNAIKFTHRGEVDVHIALLSQTGSEVELELSVRDTGIGIPQEAQARLFDDYRQADETTTRTFGGTGLGLSISRQLATLMGGELGVSSAPGVGSRFWLRIRLPLVTSAAAPIDAAHSLDIVARPLAGLRLLIVEDNELNQQIARELLMARGAEVCVASDGQQAVQQLEQAAGRFDAVLMDIQMPGMDGYAATRFIRGQLGLTKLPIIAMTANAMDSDREAARQAGMDGHLAKPIDSRQLVESLLLHIGRSQKNSSSTAASSGATADTPGILDRSAAIALLGGDDELYRSLLPMFRQRLVEVDAQLQLLQSATPRPDPGPLLHNLRGMASTMGATALAVAARQAEGSARQSPDSDLGGLLAGVSQSIAATLSALDV